MEQQREKRKPFYDIEEVKNIPIITVLRDLYGIQITQKGEKNWCAVRNEKTPSLCVYPTNTWYDFGASEGGNVINLVEFIENCDFVTALKRLTSFFRIQPQNVSEERSGLSDYEWRKLGIYPEMASKNLDIDVEKMGLKASLQYAESHRMTVEKLKDTEPKTYYKMLRDRVLFPLEESRNDYYLSLVSEFILTKEVGGEAFALNNISTEIEDMAKEINQRYSLLRRAVGNSSEVQFDASPLRPSADLKKYLDGKLEVFKGNISPIDFKKQARQKNSGIISTTIMAADYQKICSSLNDITHVAMQTNKNVTVYTLAENSSKLHAILQQHSSITGKPTVGNGRLKVQSKEPARTKKQAPLYI